MLRFGVVAVLGILILFPDAVNAKSFEPCQFCKDLFKAVDHTSTEDLQGLEPSQLCNKYTSLEVNYCLSFATTYGRVWISEMQDAHTKDAFCDDVMVCKSSTYHNPYFRSRGFCYTCQDIAAIALKVDADAAANVRFDGISIFMCQTIKPSDRSRDECIANMNQALSTHNKEHPNEDLDAQSTCELYGACSASYSSSPGSQGEQPANYTTTYSPSSVPQETERYTYSPWYEPTPYYHETHETPWYQPYTPPPPSPEPTSKKASKKEKVGVPAPVPTKTTEPIPETEPTEPTSTTGQELESVVSSPVAVEPSVKRSQDQDTTYKKPVVEEDFPGTDITMEPPTEPEPTSPQQPSPIHTPSSEPTLEGVGLIPTTESVESPTTPSKEPKSQKTLMPITSEPRSQSTQPPSPQEPSSTYSTEGIGVIEATEPMESIKMPSEPAAPKGQEESPVIGEHWKEPAPEVEGSPEGVGVIPVVVPTVSAPAPQPESTEMEETTISTFPFEKYATRVEIYEEIGPGVEPPLDVIGYYYYLLGPALYFSAYYPDVPDAEPVYIEHSGDWDSYDELTYADSDDPNVASRKNEFNWEDNSETMDFEIDFDTDVASQTDLKERLENIAQDEKLEVHPFVAT